MGNFFTSSQIYNNENLDKQQFIDKFTNAMSDNGYTVCDSDESEMSYILRFADNSKWVAVTSESYEQGGRPAQADAGRIAKMLGTTCVNTVVIDSDCAILELYDKNGKKADTFTIGRADDYFGDDIPQPSEKIWKPFLSNGSKWNRFIEICNKDEVFVEDSLSELAPVIGMDDNNILFSANTAGEDEQTNFLYFQKAPAKKETKLSLNAAFKSVYGELLEPKGFKLLKSKYPYFVRVIDDEVIQIISFMKEKAFDHDYEGFSICIGTSLTYLPLIDFDKKPMTIDNQCCMRDLLSFYHDYSRSFDITQKTIQSFSFYYKKGNIEELVNALKESQIRLIPFIFNFFDSNQTLDNLYQLGHKFMFGGFDDVVILTQNVDDHLSARKKAFPEEIQRLTNVTFKNMPEMLEIAKQKSTERFFRINQWFIDRNIGGAEHEEYIKAKNETKFKNIQLLQNLGITFKKKLSLNAAFKSVYGELLEPKGFKLLKSKYPYFVRVIDDEVIQIISFIKEKAFDHDYEGFSICIGIGLTSLPLINFDKNPMVIDNQAYMLPLSSFYQDYSKNFHTSNHLIKNFSFYYEKGNSYETKTIIKESYSKLMPFVFDIFHKCQTLEGIYQVGLKMSLGCFNDVVFLAHKVDEYLIEREIKLKEELVFLAETLYKNNPKALENAKIDAIEHYNKVNLWFANHNIGGKNYEEYIQSSKKIKNENLKILVNLNAIKKGESNNYAENN